MKKMLLSCLLLLFPMIVSADTVNIDCPSEINSGDEFVCNINAQSEHNIMALSMIASTGSGLSFVSFLPDSNWLGDGVNGYIDLYNGEDVTGDFSIGKLKLKNVSDSENTIVIDGIVFYEGKNEIAVEKVTKDIIIKKSETSNNDNNSNNTASNDNQEEINELFYSTYLADLIVLDYDLEFDKNVFDYTLHIDEEEELTIKPLLEDNSSTFEIKNNQKLKNGSKVLIVVTAKDNTSSTYTINIIKDEKKNTINNSLIFIIIIGMLLIVNFTRIIINKKNNGDKK